MSVRLPAMKKLLVLTLALTLNAISFAANTKPIEDVFQRYWSAYAKKDFVKAAADVLPSDLEEAKTALLPIFLQAQGHKDKEVQEMVATFFGRTVGKGRENLTPQDVFAGLNRLITAGNAEFFDMLKDAALSIIFVRAPDDDNAEVHFQVTIKGQSDTDAESLTKKDGRWWVRINENPKEIASHFKEMLAKKG
jgi:hypothetical protein